MDRPRRSDVGGVEHLLSEGLSWVRLIFFFFQAEDGIRDRTVTGVQTCALPIYPRRSALAIAALGVGLSQSTVPSPTPSAAMASALRRGLWRRVACARRPEGPRSEERRVGTGGGGRRGEGWWARKLALTAMWSMR